jgi:hypothetical protein
VSKWSKPGYPNRLIRLNTIDIGLPASSLSGVNFMSSLPPPPPNGIQSWPPDLNDSPQKKLQLLTSNKHLDYYASGDNREPVLLPQPATSPRSKPGPKLHAKPGLKPGSKRKRIEVKSIDGDSGDPTGPRKLRKRA